MKPILYKPFCSRLSGGSKTVLFFSLCFRGGGVQQVQKLLRAGLARRVAVRVRCLHQLAAEHRDLARRVDGETHAALVDVQDRDLDLVADQQRLPRYAAQDQYDAAPFFASNSLSRWRICQSPSSRIACMATRVSGLMAMGHFMLIVLSLAGFLTAHMT